MEKAMKTGLARWTTPPTFKAAVFPPFSRLFAGGLLLGLISLNPQIAASQQPNASDQAPNNGQDFFRPPQNLFQVLYDYKTGWILNPRNSKPRVMCTIRVFA
jgi:hypothetical protein